MTLTNILIAGCTTLALTGLAAPQDPAQQPTPFRAGVEVVSVDVLVRAGGSPVTGLTSADFELRDNGVVQQIDAISAGSVPVDLTLVMDVSGSTASLIDEFKDDVRRIVKMLRPEDRVRLLTFGNDVREVFSLRPADSRVPLDKLQPGGSTALDDGLLVALMHAPDPDRRHLIVAFTDGGENSSVIDPATLTDAAKHADGILHLVVADSMQGSPLQQAMAAEHERDLATLRTIAQAAGGDVHTSESTKHIVEDFKKVFDDFRGSYVLRFTPRDVAPGGWHAIVVKVTKPGVYQLQARQGYFGG